VREYVCVDHIGIFYFAMAITIYCSKLCEAYSEKKMKDISVRVVVSCSLY